MKQYLPSFTQVIPDGSFRWGAAWVLLALGVPAAHGQGFGTTATNWTLPAGGAVQSNGHANGFNNIYGPNSANSNSQGWSVLDLNGDARPDLVVTSQGTSGYGDGFGVGTSSPYWKVYLATATGFATTATNWTLPAGGALLSNGHAFGFNAVTNVGSTLTNDQGWSVLDLTGDGLADLVVTSQGNGTYNDGFGVGTSLPHWKVYPGTGSGFAATPLAWTLPAGGVIMSNGHVNGFNILAGGGGTVTGSQGWVVRDFNNDRRPDLVVTSQGVNSYNDSFGVGTSSPYWKVYLATATGFATTATNWTLPAGGAVLSNNHAFGYNNTANAGSTNNNDRGWSVLDVNHDNQLDLVVTNQGNGTYNDCFSVSANPYWLVYPGAGTGFANTPVNWPLPAGGLLSANGHASGFNSLANGAATITNGSQAWTVADFSSDGWPDLVVYRQNVGVYGDAFSVGANSYWKVYKGSASGFATAATNWALPAGGAVYANGHASGFYGMNNGGSVAQYDQGWMVLDVNADGSPDLVVTNQGNGTYNDSYDVGTNPHWLVYTNAVVTATQAGAGRPALAAYPNPTAGELTLDCPPAVLGRPYTVADALGRILRRGTLAATSQPVDLRELPAGLYVLQAGPQTLRILKQ